MILLLLLLAGTPQANHVDVVAQVKAELEAKHADLSGACGAFQITKRVAWRLRAEGAGLLSKPSGNNCDGYSVDYVLFANGSGFDILGDAGGANSPGWGGPDTDPSFPARWRAPVDPGDDVVSVPPVTAPPPVVVLPPPVDLSGINTQLAAIAKAIADHEAADASFRDDARGAYKRAVTFLFKYIVPAVATFFGGRAMAK